MIDRSIAQAVWFLDSGKSLHWATEHRPELTVIGRPQFHPRRLQIESLASKPYRPPSDQFIVTVQKHSVSSYEPQGEHCCYSKSQARDLYINTAWSPRSHSSRLYEAPPEVNPIAFDSWRTSRLSFGTLLRIEDSSTYLRSVDIVVSEPQHSF